MKNIACATLVVGISLMGSIQISANYMQFISYNSSWPVHIEQKQEVDGKWRIESYWKYPIGSYDTWTQRKTMAGKVLLGGIGVTGLSIAVALCRNGIVEPRSLEADAIRVAFSGGFIVSAASLCVWTMYKDFLHTYAPGYIAKDSHGNPLKQTYEYYELYKGTGFKNIPVPIEPTITTIPNIRTIAR